MSTVSTPHLPAIGASIAEAEPCVPPRALAREAARILDEKGVQYSPAMLRKLMARFVADGHTTLAELEPYLLGYRDPTGETAVRNVMRGRGR